MSNLTKQTNKIYLSAKNFIKALQGEIILDKEGKKHHFFNYTHDVKSVGIVVIDHRVVVSESINIIGSKSLGKKPEFKYPIVISGGEFQAKFQITVGEFQESFNISGGEFKSWFLISGGEFKSEFRIEGGEFQKLFSIEGGKFQKRFSVEGGKFQKRFLISGGEFKSEFRIEGGSFKLFRILGGDFKFMFLIKGGMFQFTFRIDGGEFYIFRILGGQLTWFGIFGGKFQEKVSVEGGIFTQGIIVENHTEKAIIRRFENLILITSKFIVKTKSQIHFLIFKEGVTSGGSTYIESIHLQELAFVNFINEGKLEITGVKPLENATLSENKKTQIILSESNLGNAVFKATEFKDFDQIVIDDSKINNISTVNKHFPLSAKNLGNETDDKGNLKHDLKQMGEIYSQLCLAMQKQGYKTQEMRYYTAYLRWELADAFRQFKLGKFLSLTFSKLSTNFGQSWLLGVGWLVVLSFFLFWCYTAQLEFIPKSEKVPLEVYSDVKQIKVFWSDIYQREYIRFINPIRKGQLINHTKLTRTLVFIDFLWRIIFSYLTYQIITAFRRFGRK